MKMLEQFLSEEEGISKQPYYDTRGYVTWGIGHLGDPRLICPVPMEIIKLMFKYDQEEKIAQAMTIPGFSKLNELQQTMLVSMIFQMGFEPFDGDGFKDFAKFLAAIRDGNIARAAAEGLDSKWAREDSPKRAQRTMEILRTGVWVAHGN